MSAARFRRAPALAGAIAALLVLIWATSTSAAAPRSFFGVMPQGPLDAEDFDAMGEARVGTLRFEIHWAGIDPSATPDDYDWSSTDAIVRQAGENDVSMLAFVTSVPAWALALDGHNCDPGDCPPYAPKGKQALAAWRTFLGDVVQRYGPQGEFWAENPTVPKHPIRDWQIWNEQNSPSFYKPKPNVKSYAKLLDASEDAISAEDRGAKIILGGMFGTPLGGQKPAVAAWDFLAKLYKQKGAKRDFDGVAPHPYASKLSKVLAQIDLIREEMKRAGDRNGELWITELGWASGGPPNPLNRGLAGQADRLTEAYRYFLRKRRKLNVENVTWYSWRDNSSTTSGLCEWCPKSGLLNEDHSAKPSFDAFRKLTGAG